MTWHACIIECKDTKLYTGITNNLERRVKAYNSGNGGKFTMRRTPVKLLYSELCRAKPRALRREAQIKGMTRAQKLELINRSHGAQRNRL